MIRQLLGATALTVAAASTASAQFVPGYPPHHHPHPLPAPVVVYAPPRPVPVFVPAPAPQVYTVNDFVKCFRPTDGHHRVFVVHPHTGRPVEVCFNLPCARLKEVEVCGNSIEFNYVGARDVKIAFRHDGTVRVFGN